MATTQSERLIRLTTPYGEDVLLASRAAMTEELGRCFELEIVAASENGDLDPDKILGESATLECILGPESGSRFLNGHVTEFTQTGDLVDGLHGYQLQIRPWLWFLTRASDCRVFQEKSVLEIVEEVFSEYGFSSYELRLKGSYAPWEYCVQYRETDLNFVSRLLEQEGIYFFFSHEKESHTLILADDPTSHKPIAGYESLPFYPLDQLGVKADRDYIDHWRFSKSVRAGSYALADFDFEKPQNDLVTRSKIQRPHKHASFEMFDFPGEYSPLERASGEQIAKKRIQELQADHHVFYGEGSAIGLEVGGLFKLTGHPRKDQDEKYLVTHAQLTLASNEFRSSGSGSIESSVAVRCIESKSFFRPARTTPKPLVTGTQSALVVGKAGEEIWTDKYGRVKVQFHWDRHGSQNETSSCWVRVAQLWAGKKWGGIQIPRIGEEVLVSFFDGDPDRPVITGRVYNGDSMPPYDLPANATQSGVKSRSSKGGGEKNFNEFRFEDKKGEEEVYLHAEKDFNSVVENDKSVHIMHDDTVKIDNDLDTLVGNDEKRHVKANRQTAVDKDETVEIGANHSEDTGKKYELTAGDEIILQTGAAKIVMKKNGDIEISGKNISITGSAKVEVKASQKASIDCPKIAISGTQVDVKGTKTSVEGSGMLDLKSSGIASLKGSLTKIG